RRFDELVDAIGDQLLDPDGTLGPWAPRAITGGTVNAFLRRLAGAQRHVQHLIRADVGAAGSYRVDFDAQVTVVDIHNLNDRAQRFVVGVLLRQAFELKERAGTAKPLQLIVLDELNKYAPREGSSPIKEILLDVAERRGAHRGAGRAGLRRCGARGRRGARVRRHLRHRSTDTRVGAARLPGAARPGR